MFNEKLLYKICERYGIEIRKGKGKSVVVDEDGTEREITEDDIKEILGIEKGSEII